MGIGLNFFDGWKEILGVLLKKILITKKNDKSALTDLVRPQTGEAWINQRHLSCFQHFIWPQSRCRDAINQQSSSTQSTKFLVTNWLLFLCLINIKVQSGEWLLKVLIHELIRLEKVPSWFGFNGHLRNDNKSWQTGWLLVANSVTKKNKKSEWYLGSIVVRDRIYGLSNRRSRSNLMNDGVWGRGSSSWQRQI